MNKGQKHKSKNTKSTKTQKNQKTTKTRKSKNKKQTKQVQLPKPEGGRKEKEKRTKGGDGVLWCPDTIPPLLSVSLFPFFLLLVLVIKLAWFVFCFLFLLLRVFVVFWFFCVFGFVFLSFIHHVLL